VVAGRCFPIAINQTWLNSVLGQPIPEGGIQFNPDGQDNGGWAAPIDEQPSGSNLRDWITDGFSEQITIDNLINLNNGTVDSAINVIKQQLPSHSQNYTLSDGTNFNGWMVMAPVVTVNRFNRDTNVVAFQTMIIIDVDVHGSPKTIQVVFYGQPMLVNNPVLVDGGIPGGPPSNLLANIPQLVQ
jgi:hypothetical protein